MNRSWGVMPFLALPILAIQRCLELQPERLWLDDRILGVVPPFQVIASPRAVILVSHGFLLGGATAQADSDAFCLPFGRHWSDETESVTTPTAQSLARPAAGSTTPCALPGFASDIGCGVLSVDPACPRPGPDGRDSPNRSTTGAPRPRLRKSCDGRGHGVSPATLGIAAGLAT
jgi:hypothetical protein